MSYPTNTTRPARDPYILQQAIDKAVEWTGTPLSARAECIVAAVVGSLTFLLFVLFAGLS